MSHLILLILLEVLVPRGSRQADHPNLDALFALLQDRETSSNAAASLEELCRAKPDTIAIVRARLPSMLAIAKDEMVERAEAKVVEDLRISEAIPALAQLLQTQSDFASWETLYRKMNLVDDPIAHALSQLGDAALPAMSNLLKDENATVRRRTALALLLMKTPASIALLRLHLDTETDIDLVAMIRGNLPESR